MKNIPYYLVTMVFYLLRLPIVLANRASTIASTMMQLNIAKSKIYQKNNLLVSLK